MINDVIQNYKKQGLTDEEIKESFELCISCIRDILNTSKTYDDVIMDLVNLKASQYQSRNKNHHFYISELAKILLVEMVYDQNLYTRLTNIAKENNIIKEDHV